MDSAKKRTSWEFIEIDPREVLLDENNPRMPGITPNQSRSQEALCNIIIRTDAFVRLCESITSFGGVYPFENVILLREDGKLIAFEGNRRICACKVLLEPEKYLHDAKQLAAIPRASEEVLEDLSNISAYIVESREAGAALLAHLHGFPKFNRETWHTVNRMNFVRSALDAGTSIEELAQQFGVPEKDIVELNHNYKILYEFRYGLDWDNELKRYLFDHPEDRDFESFLHVVTSPSVKRHFGEPFITNDSTLNWDGHPDIKEKLLLIARHTVLASFVGSSRYHKKHESVEKYLDDVWPRDSHRDADSEDLFKDDFGTSHSSLESQGELGKLDISGASAPEAKLNEPRAGDQRIAPYRHDELFGRFECSRKEDDRLMELCRELRRLSNLPDGISCFSLAFCLLLRALLEWSLIYHLEHSGNHKTKGQNGRYLPLRQIVKYCLNRGQVTFDSGPVIEKLSLVERKWLDELHLLTHTNAGNRSEIRVKEMVGDIKPVLRYILNEANYG